jgi:ketosteroid isomerase-like protein
MITAESFFDRLNKKTMHLVDDFYASDAEFMDPVVHLKGAAEIRAYYTRLYDTVKSIRFEHGPALVQGDTIVLSWTMRLVAALDNGREVVVDGVSVMRRNPAGKVVYHRDYFDMGQFVYERVFLLGAVVRYAKRVLAGPFVRRAQ